MAVKKDFSTLRASGSKVVEAVGYTAAALSLSSRALVVAAARMNEYLASDMGAEAKKLVANIDSQLQEK